MKSISTPLFISSEVIALSFAAAVGFESHHQAVRYIDTEEEIREIESEILGYVASITEAFRIKDSNESPERFLGLSLPHWPLSSYEFSSLTYGNRQKAEAMILSAYRQPPSSLDSLVKWRDREADAGRDWEITDTSATISEALFKGVFTFASLPLIYVALLAIGWLWYFLLRRVAELINSLKGKIPNKSPDSTNILGMQILIRKNGKIIGPFSSDQITAMLDTGLIDPKDIASREGNAAWQPIHQILGLCPPVPDVSPSPAPARGSVSESAPQIKEHNEKPVEKPRIKAKLEESLDSRYRGVHVIGWLLVIFATFALLAPPGEGLDRGDRLSGNIAYLLGANVLPLTALVAGISSFRRLWTIGPILLIIYSSIIIAAISIRLF